MHSWSWCCRFCAWCVRSLCVEWGVGGSPDLGLWDSGTGMTTIRCLFLSLCLCPLFNDAFQKVYAYFTPLSIRHCAYPGRCSQIEASAALGQDRRHHWPCIGAHRSIEAGMPPSVYCLCCGGWGGPWHPPVRRGRASQHTPTAPAPVSLCSWSHSCSVLA